MNDCQNVLVREALPDLAHGALPESERTRVLMHLDICDDCADELAIIRAVIAITITPAVDVAAISAAIPAYPVHRDQVHQRRFHVAHLNVAHLRLAAALLVGAAGVSALVVEHQRGTVASSVTVAAGQAGSSLAGQGSGVALVGTADLSDDNLAQLIQSMAHIDAVPPAEPDPVMPAVFDGDAS
ncbi:MAG: zf-HC2 domain-containing protein [Gemmatimonadaceae bacterium]